DQAYALLKKYYGEIPAQSRPSPRIPEEPEQREEHRLGIHDRDAPERVAVAYHVTSAEHDDSYALDVLASILFDGTSSRAYQKLVEEKDLLTGISGSAFTPTYPGLFIISGNLKQGMKNEDIEPILDEVIADVQR